MLGGTSLWRGVVSRTNLKLVIDIWVAGLFGSTSCTYAYWSAVDTASGINPVLGAGREYTGPTTVEGKSRVRVPRIAYQGGERDLVAAAFYLETEKDTPDVM